MLAQLRRLGLAMGGSYPPREFTTTDEGGEQSTVMRQLCIGYTTDESKAAAARDLGATVTRCPSADPAFIGWEVSISEVVDA